MIIDYEKHLETMMSLELAELLNDESDPNKREVIIEEFYRRDRIVQMSELTVDERMEVYMSNRFSIHHEYTDSGTRISYLTDNHKMIHKIDTDNQSGQQNFEFAKEPIDADNM